MSAKKNTETHVKKSAASSRGRNVLREARATAAEIPSEEDICFIRETRLPPPLDGRVIHNTYTAFPPASVDALRWPAVADFFGSRVKAAAVAEQVEQARRTEEIAARLEHAKALLAQIGAPANANLYTVAGLIVRDWDDLSRQLPDAAEKLQPIYDWWVASHPGGSRAAKEDSPTPAPKNATPA